MLLQICNRSKTSLVVEDVVEDDEEAGADWAIGFPDAAFSVAPRSLFMHSLSNKKKRKQNQD